MGFTVLVLLVVYDGTIREVMGIPSVSEPITFRFSNDTLDDLDEATVEALKERFPEWQEGNLLGEIEPSKLTGAYNNLRIYLKSVEVENRKLKL